MTKTQWLILGALVLAVVTVCACMGIVILFALTPTQPSAQSLAALPSVTVQPLPTPTSTNTPIPTSTSTPTQTSTPTRVLSPTRTLTPTRTPIPSATPKPSATRTPTRGYSAAEVEYTQSMTELTSTYGSAMQELGKLLEAAGDDASLILDNKWKVNVGFQIGIAQFTGKEIRALKPPPRFADAHSDLVQATKYFDKAFDLLVDGIDNLDINKITKAVPEMNQGYYFLDRATTKIKKITGQ